MADASAGAESVVTEASLEVVGLFNKGACIGCHMIPGVPGAVGPDLTLLGSEASTRQDGVSARDYIYDSIVNPEAFIAPECPTGPCLAGLILPTFSQALDDAEIEQLVDYLATLR